MADEKKETRELLDLRIEYFLEKIQHAKGEELECYRKILETLCKAKNESDKNDFDYDDKYNRRVMEDAHHDAEMEIKQQEIAVKKEELEFRKSQEKNQNIRTWITVGGSLLGVALGWTFSFIAQRNYQIWETNGGIPTSLFFKSLISKQVPKI